MDYAAIKLGVSARLSDKELMSKFRLVLDYCPSKECEIILLCDFSEHRIPLGFVFDSIEDLNGQIVFSGGIILKKVSQQFVLPFDSLPQGWKTICKFQFTKLPIPALVRLLPAASYWFNSQVNLFLLGNTNAQLP